MTHVITSEERRLDDRLLRSLIAREDPIGALSIYCAGAAASDDLAPVADLIELEVARLRARGHARVADAVVIAGERVVRRLAGDPRLAAARGHAVFCGLAHDWWHHQPLPIRPAPIAAVSRRPFVRPLIAAIEDGRPAGAVLVGPRAVRCYEWSMGEIGEPWLVGPPAEPSIVERVDRLATECGWREIVLAGEARLTTALESLAGDRLVVADVDGALDGRAGAGLAAAIGGEVATLRASARTSALAGVVEAAASASPHVAVGAADVLAALHHERVDALIFDNERSLTGVWLPDGRLARSAGGWARCEVQPEPMMLERMIERALAGRARLVPLRADEAEPLAPLEGVAATLRW